MKKALTLLFAVAMVFAFALPAMADAGKYLGAANLTMKMQLWQWGVSSENLGDMDDDVHDKQNSVKQRLRWWLNTDFGDYGAVIGFESDWVWGSDSSGGSDTGAAVAPASGGVRGDDLINVEMKRAYAWFNIPHTPVKVTAGLGVQGGVDPNDLMFGGDDYFGVRLDLPLGESFTLSGAWLKWDEGENNIPGYTVVPGDDFDSNDTNIFYIDLDGSIGKLLTVGTYHFWMHVNENGAAILSADTATYGFMGGRPALPVTEGDYFWHGFNAELNMGIFWASGHFNYFWGDPEDDNVTPEASGWAAIGEVGVKPGPFEVSVRGWYFTGNDYEDDGEWNRWTAFNSFFAPLEIWQSGYNSWRAGGQNGYEDSPGGHAFIGIDADWYVTKKMSLHFLGGPIWATEELDKPLNAVLADALTGNDDKFLGFEIDGRCRYKLYDHLELQLGIAYFFAGDGLEHVNPAGEVVEADDAYELFWRLYYSF